MLLDRCSSPAAQPRRSFAPGYLISWESRIARLFVLNPYHRRSGRGCFSALPASSNSLGRDLTLKLQKVSYARYIGVDVSKAALDVDDSAGTIDKKVANDQQVIIRKMISQIDDPTATLVICEGTGGYERKLVEAMHTAGVPIVVANPRQVRDFASGHGILEKSDPIDAAVIRCFGEDVRNLKLATPKSDDQESHAAMARRRKQLLEMINQEKNRLVQTADTDVAELIGEHLETLNKQLKHVDQEIRKMVAKEAKTNRTVEVLQSVPGVGTVMTSTIICHLPELGKLSRGEISKLVGVAPLVRQSGRHQGKRMIIGGRGHVRHVLYMATLVATRHNPLIKRFYTRLVAKGKEKKVALIASMRKLLTILNDMVRNGECWRHANLSESK